MTLRRKLGEPSPIETIPGAGFAPFRRLSGNRTTHPHGAGLGLSIVRSIAAAHGGQLSATARDHGGLTIRIRLVSGSQAEAERRVTARG